MKHKPHFMQDQDSVPLPTSFYSLDDDDEDDEYEHYKNKFQKRGEYLTRKRLDMIQEQLDEYDDLILDDATKEQWNKWHDKWKLRWKTFAKRPKTDKNQPASTPKNSAKKGKKEFDIVEEPEKPKPKIVEKKEEPK